MRHIFIHLLNDYSGSPRILNDRISVYSSNNKKIHIITNDKDGFIELHGKSSALFNYKKSNNIFLKLIRYWIWMIRVSIYLLFYIKENDVVHGNTMLTAPLFMAAKLKKAATISHVMETKIRPNYFKIFLRYFIKNHADQVIFISKFLLDVEGFHNKNTSVVYPKISNELISSDMCGKEKLLENNGKYFNVTMICSLSWSKGIQNFINLAMIANENKEKIKFILVISSTEKEISRFLLGIHIPSNIEIRSKTNEISKILEISNLIISLTLREQWIETFALTLAEAMSFGLPVIAPDIGAQTEYITNGYNGYLVNEKDIVYVFELIKKISADKELYKLLSINAVKTSKKFNIDQYNKNLQKEIHAIENCYPWI